MQSEDRKDDVPYAVLVNAYAKAGKHEAYDSILERMKTDGVEPTVVVYNALINAHSKADAPEKARKVFEKMLEVGMFLTR